MGAEAHDVGTHNALNRARQTEFDLAGVDVKIGAPKGFFYSLQAVK